MKKMYSKILSVALALVFMLMPISTIAAQDITVSELASLSVLPEGMEEGNMEKPVTRAEFSYMATHLIERENFIEADTKFSDVSKSDKYSGHIEFLTSMGIINGVTETEFCPYNPVSAVMAFKIIIKVLGYDMLAEQKGGYPYGYIAVADILGLSSIVSALDDALSVREASSLIYEALTQEFPQVGYGNIGGSENVWLEKSTFSVLERLKISSYTGKIKETSKDGKSVLFEVLKNNYETNYVSLEKGDNVRFDIKNGIDAYEYENIPIKIYVDENEKIICITENKKYEVIYAYITEINGDGDANASYSPSKTDRISFSGYEDEFDTAEGYSLSVAGKPVTTQAKINGSFAKVVLFGGDVYYVDAWPVEEGGIITEIAPDSISYTYRAEGTKKLKDISSYENVYIYINGKRTDYHLIKKNTVFDFYAQGDTLMITCCEKVISDVLYTISSDKAEIAGMYYRFDSLYYCVDTNYEEYTPGTENRISKLLGKDVTGYFAPDGLLRYITKTSEIDTGEFYAITLGVGEENISGETEIKLLKIYPTQETVIYKLTEKTMLPEPDFDIASLTSCRDNNGFFNGDAIYVFEKNSKGEIVKIKNPDYIKGFGDGPIKKENITSIANMGGGYVSLQGKPYFFQSSPIIAVYEENGKPVSKPVEWVKIYNRQVENATMVFFGKKIEDDPELVVLCGNLNKLGNNVISRGILLDKNQALDENGETAVEIEVLSRSGSIDKYIMPEEKVKDLPRYALISYYTGQVFSDNPIHIVTESTINLSKPVAEWTALTDGKTSGFQKGTVSAISSTRLCVENDGKVYVNCIHPSRCIIAEYDSESLNYRYKAIDTADIEIGDTVYYNLLGEGIEAIIAIH